MIMSLSDIMAQAQRNRSIATPPEAEYRKQYSSISELLLKSGYEKRNPELFHELCDYATCHTLHCEPRGLLLIGPCSIGKTEGVRRLSAILRMEYCTVQELLQNFGSPEYYKQIAASDFFGTGPRDLIIDEVGTEPIPLIHWGTKYNMLEEVFYIRYNGYKDFGSRTVVTTNKTLSELKELYGVRVSERFWESFRIREFSGESLRRVK